LKFYDFAARANYEVWCAGEKWKDATQLKRLVFFRGIKSLEELLPVYDESLLKDGTVMAWPGYSDNPLWQLNQVFNQRSFDRYAWPCVQDSVCALVFYSDSRGTIRLIRLQPSCFPPLYPHGIPDSFATDDGDGTVVWKSATMEFDANGHHFPRRGGSVEEHSFLAGSYAETIRDFLLGMGSSGSVEPAGAPQKKDNGPTGDLPPDLLGISVSGRNQPWILAPSQVGAGISPLTSAYTNAWPQAVVEVDAYSSSFELSAPEAGLYQGSLGAFPGEIVRVNVLFTSTNEASVADLRWIGNSNGISFGILLDPAASNAVTLLPVIDPPQELASFSSNSTCHLAWLGAAGTNVAGYRIYARRSDESLFSLLGATTNSVYDSGHPWVSGTNGPNWYYTVVAVTTNGDESPYADMVKNSQPTLARFTANLTSGTPPLTVTFTNQSLGGVTNWAWDFDSDGNIDSVEENPNTVFAEVGSYTVTLTVSGLDGADTRIAVGYITVSRPELSAIALKPDRTIELALSAQAGRNYEIQVSTNLTAWTTLVNLTTTNATTVFNDISATNFSQRFYRAVVP
jgi:PKD repeat protein